jgi:hypothetical protein
MLRDLHLQPTPCPRPGQCSVIPTELVRSRTFGYFAAESLYQVHRHCIQLLCRPSLATFEQLLLEARHALAYREPCSRL